MTQKAIVKELLSEREARICLMRQLECGLSCKSCEGCPQKPTDELLAAADNTQCAARPGDVVEVVSNAAGVYLAAFYTFVLPCIGLIAGYLLAAAAGIAPVFCLLCSFGGSVLLFLPAVRFNSLQKRSDKAEFTIVRILR